MTRATRSYRRLAIASAAAGVIVLVTVLASRGSSQRAASCRATLIPAYVSPAAIVKLVEGPLRPRVVVVNPANGPGAEASSAYRHAVRKAQAAGTRVLGYVSTSYGARDASEVAADVAHYASWYEVDGMFFDEAAHSAEFLPYYRALAGRVHASGRQLVVLNPGVVPARGYFDVADVVVTFEGPYSAYAAALSRMPDWVRHLAPERVAHLVYGASRAEAVAAARSVRGAGYLYVTSGSMPDPWRAFPSYLREEEELLAACS